MKLPHFSVRLQSDEEAVDVLEAGMAFIGGIALNILEGKSNEASDLSYLDTEVIRGNSVVGPLIRRGLVVVAEFDVSHMPDVLEYAQKLEKLRELCARRLVNEVKLD